MSLSRQEAQLPVDFQALLDETLFGKVNLGHINNGSQIVNLAAGPKATWATPYLRLTSILPTIGEDMQGGEIPRAVTIQRVTPRTSTHKGGIETIWALQHSAGKFTNDSNRSTTKKDATNSIVLPYTDPNSPHFPLSDMAAIDIIELIEQHPTVRQPQPLTQRARVAGGYLLNRITA